MKKIIFYENNNKKFKLTQRYTQRFQELGLSNIPTKVGEYDNADEMLINAVEQIRTEIPQLLTVELKQYLNYQNIQSHFMQVFSSFESFAIQFWIKMIALNPQLTSSKNLNNLYNGIIYGYSHDEFLQVCKDNRLTLSEELQHLYNALIARREVVTELRKRRDAGYDEYQKFCMDVGMRTCSHIPPIDGFKIVEYDETKFQAKIKIQINSFGSEYEELELMPI